MTTRAKPGLFVFVAFLCGLRVACAHPFHVSIAEAEFNPRTGNLEVALRVHPTDLELALRDRFERPVNLDQTDNRAQMEQVDRLIAKYLQETLVLHPFGKEPLALQWVGKEVSAKYAWLYFEFPCPQFAGRWEVRNRLFFTRLPDQVNTMTFKQDGNEVSLNFTRLRVTQSLILPLEHERIPRVGDPD